MNVNDVIEALDGTDLEQRLEWAARNLGPAVFSTSFGKDDQVITQAIAAGALDVRVFTLDTGRLFEETRALHATTLERYGLAIHVFHPDAAALDAFVTAKGPNAFHESVETRLECCRLRKVEPLRRALTGAGVWITGLRRGQSANRSNLPVAEWDRDHGILKVHPLVDWDDRRLEERILEANIPVNRLHAKGYASIGCAPCTRPVAEGSDPRSGRWWWEDATKRECGLHLHAGEKA